MKKIMSFVLLVSLIVTLTACGNSNSSSKSDDQQETTKEESNDKEVVLPDIPTMTLEELEEKINTDTQAVIEKLNNEKNQLFNEVNTYELYTSQLDKVNAFYETVLQETTQLGIQLREYSLMYAQIVLNNEEGYDEKYDQLDGIYDYIYNDAGKDMYDIYDVLLGEMYDQYYDGILDDAYDYVEYDEWSDYRSDEYDIWSDTRSDVYDEWSDMRSDIYDFSSDLRSDVYDHDDKRIQKGLLDFYEDLLSLKE